MVVVLKRLLLAWALTFATGCGYSEDEWQAQLKKYDELLAEHQREEKEADATRAELEASKAQAESLRSELKKMGVNMETLTEQLQQTGTQKEELAKSLQELQQTITLSKYKEWAYYDRLRASNIAAAYNNLKLYR